MRFVPVKSVEQQDIQCLHRVRERRVHERTAVANQMRGLLREYGVFLARGIQEVRRRIPEVLEDAENELTPLSREIVAELYERLGELDHSIKGYEDRIKGICRDSEICQRLVQVEGVGPLTATALVAAVGDPRAYRNGRHLAAWLGLVPRQHSSGQRHRLLGISKRVDRYLRTLLIHGARAVIYRCDTKSDARSRWIRGVKARRGINRASVALANKNARILWALMALGEVYRKAA